MEKKIAFDEGIKRDNEFEELEKIYLEIRELELRLAKYFDNSEFMVLSLKSSMI